MALVDQEASMLDLVKSGVGLSLVRDSIAMRESQARGLVVADRVSLDCALSFVCPEGAGGRAGDCDCARKRWKWCGGKGC